MCRELGFAHPDYLLGQLTANQLSEWEAYDRLEPIGKQRDDYRTALLCSTVSNLAISLWGKKGTKMTTVKDFLLNWDGESQREAPKEQSVEEMKALMLSLVKHTRNK